MEQKSPAEAVRSALVELNYMVRLTGLIQEDEYLIYIPGSRSHGQEPQVNVRGPRGPRLLEVMPDFTHLTRAREVAVAMETAAATLRNLRELGLIP